MYSKLTEEDIKRSFVTPSIINKSAWSSCFVRMEHYFTDGQVLVNDNEKKRGKQKKADYLLLAKNKETPLAIVEVKSGKFSISDGLAQAIEYSGILDIPFAYSTNGDGFIERDILAKTERYLTINEFPTQSELWQRYLVHKKITKTEEKIIQQPYYINPFKEITPRYYQRIAIDRTIEAIAFGKRRILLVMANGTGKTYTAFQIIWRLKKFNPSLKALYLADRNILINQTINNDFKPFEKIITKVKGRNLDSSYEIYMSLYQQLAGDEGNESFRQFKPEFFDLIIIDECHRGSAKEESQWRKVLDYFSSAIQVGLTATPKETKNVSNINYFGEPIYTYSLKKGIEDGFLAPYKVIRVSIDRDIEGDSHEIVKTDSNDKLIEDRGYDCENFDKKLIIDDRTKLIAKRITTWLKENGRDSKTIIFCTNIVHAERMCQAMVNENSDIVKEHPDYIMQITGDNKIGKDKLDYFIDVNEPYPTIVTTSKLMTTGVDCKTCKLIVLENNIESVTEFKQIIGRGTRLNTEHDKWFFTIMDFRDVSRLFSDKDFDGEPITIIENSLVTDDDNDVQNNGKDNCPDIINDSEIVKSKKICVSGIEATILNKQIQIIRSDGKLITESLTKFTKQNILDEYATLYDFIQAWHKADKKQTIIDKLEEHGVLLSTLQQVSDNKDYDPFDLILHIAYDKKPLTKAKRVNKVKKSGYLDQYDEICQKVLSVLLDKYINEGITSLEDNNILNNTPFNLIGSPIKIANLFGGINLYNKAIIGLKNELYSSIAYQ